MVNGPGFCLFCNLMPVLHILCYSLIHTHTFILNHTAVSILRWCLNDLVKDSTLQELRVKNPILWLEGDLSMTGQKPPMVLLNSSFHPKWNEECCWSHSTPAGCWVTACLHLTSMRPKAAIDQSAHDRQSSFVVVAHSCTSVVTSESDLQSISALPM